VPDAALGGFYDLDFVTVQGAQGDAILAVAEDNEFWASLDPTALVDGLYIHGNFVVNGNDFTATGLQIALPGFAFMLDNGQQVPSVNVTISNGRVDSLGGLRGDITVAGIAGTGSFTAVASAAQRQFYAQDSSLNILAGRYQDIRTGTQFDITIGADGSITDNTINCTITGDIAPIDSRFNLYEFQITVSACPGFVEGNYGGAASLDEIAGNPVLITAGDNNSNALFVYIMDKI